jgi:phosphate transport system substrate-binding protein
VNRLLLILVGLASAGIALRAGNGANVRSYAAVASVSGELTAIGPDTMEPVMQRWIAAFRRLQPDAKIRFTTTESESRDRTALGPDTAEVFAGSTELFAEKYHYEPLRVMVSLATFDTPKRVQALAIFVHPSNPLKGLTLAQLDRIYSAAHRRGYPRELKTWGDLGLMGEWAGRPIHAYSRVLDNEVTAHIREVVCRGAEFSPAVAVPGKGVSVDVVGAVAADPGGIGFAGFAYLNAGVRALALAENSGAPLVEATPATCAANLYPLDRPLCFYVNRRPGTALDPVLREFIRFVLSADGQAINAQEKYFPLTPSLLAGELAKLN